MKKQTLTIGIPTCYGGASLVKTVESIVRSCEDLSYVIHIVADTTPFNKHVKRKLAKYNTKITWNKIPSGQFAKDKQIIKDCTTDILILTQDDVIFAPDLATKIISEFTQNRSITMLVAKVIPENQHHLVEKIVSIGAYLSNEIAQRWNGGDNYLAANGRCMAFRTSIIKKLSIPDDLVSGDAYLYFENKRIGGKFNYLSSTYIRNKSPIRLKEYLNQSKRFQNTKEELSKYMIIEEKEFTMPKKVILISFLSVFLSHSLSTIFYLGILAYSRLTSKSKNISPFWDIDISTKRL